MSVKYDSYFTKAAQKYDVDKNLLIAVAQTESGIKADAVSSAGAIGVMQLMPSTAQSLGVKNVYDAEQNIMGGAKYLSQLLTEFDGNKALALSAYNGGITRVKENGGVLSYTEGYVNKVLENYNPNSITAQTNTGRGGGTYEGQGKREEQETELVWWGDIVRVVLILVIIIAGVLLFVASINSMGGSTNPIKTVTKSLKGGKNDK